uniref:hypothetical protein n=1 Tax=Paracoccus denitrificans TaxID=266 RepID=UPI00131A1CB8
RVFMLDRPFHRSIHLMPLSQKPAPPQTAMLHPAGVFVEPSGIMAAITGQRLFATPLDQPIIINAGN